MNKHFCAAVLFVILSLYISVTLQKKTAKELESQKPITINALGMSWSLGDLYDGRTEQFCGQTIFKKRPGDDSGAIRTIQRPSSKIKFIESHDMTDKIAGLGIDVTLGLAISLAIVKFSFNGAARYLNDKQDNYNKQVLSLVYDITTVDEMLNIFHGTFDKSDDFINDPLINKTNATHVVTGINYGAKTIIKCTFDLAESFSRTEVKSQLGGGLGLKSVIRTELQVELNHTKGSIDRTSNFDMTFFGDVLPPEGTLPTTFAEAHDVVKQMPDLLKNVNGGRGKPQEYRLMPITVLKEIRKQKLEAAAVLNQLQEGRMTQILRLLDKTKRAKFFLQQFYKKVLENREYIRRQDRMEVYNYTRLVKRAESKFKNDIVTILTKLRSGNGSQAELDYIINTFARSAAFPKTVDRKIAGWATIDKKIEFGRRISNHGAHFVRSRDFASEYVRTGDQSYALYFKNHETVMEKANARDWGRNKQLLYSELQNNQDSGRENKYIAVDCDITFADICNSPNFTSVLRVYRKGNVTSADLLAERREMEDDCGLMLWHLNMWDEVSAEANEIILYVYDEKEKI